MMFFDPKYFLFLAPAMLLAAWAKMKVQITYAAGQRVPASLSGAAAARRVLDSAGLSSIQIEQVPGELTDHYDPQNKVLRLSASVYQGRNAAAVGVAAHEAGHALQDAESYAPMLLRNAAVPAASFGGGFSMALFGIGLLMHLAPLIWAGIALFGCVVFFQVVNLPVEIDASNRAKRQLASLGIVDDQGLGSVRSVLNAAAWTYVAGTLQAIMTLLYWFSLLSRRDEQRG